MYFSKNPKSLMTNDLRDLRDQGLWISALALPRRGKENYSISEIIFSTTGVICGMSSSKV